MPANLLFFAKIQNGGKNSDWWLVMGGGCFVLRVTSYVVSRTRN